MHKFQSVPAPVATLWGSPQQSEQILPGVWEVHTASHGGIILSQERTYAITFPAKIPSLLSKLNTARRDVDAQRFSLTMRDRASARGIPTGSPPIPAKRYRKMRAGSCNDAPPTPR